MQSKWQVRAAQAAGEARQDEATTVIANLEAVVLRTENARRTSIAANSTATVTERHDAKHAAGAALIAVYAAKQAAKGCKPSVYAEMGQRRNLGLTAAKPEPRLMPVYNACSAYSGKPERYVDIGVLLRRA